MDISNVAYERKDNTSVYTTFPQIHELCCVICQTDFIEVQDSSSKSNFHWQTMKCRLLIHVVSNIIASPVLGTDKLIFVITHKKFFETGKLEKILRHFKLVHQGIRPITTELYKNCLIFTIQTKIAPLWNKVGQYFLQGKEFYSSIEAVNALKLNVFVEEKNICLQLHAEKIKIPYIKLEDYLPSSVLSEFLSDPKGYIDLSHYKFPFIYVLPSTKKGKLVSVSKQIPIRCPFKDYTQLRRHWKNMYGYSLPKSQDQILYYEIKFLIPKSNVFTYPNLCIASGPLDMILNRNKEFTITHFLSDMLVKLPTVCGRQLQISRHTPLNTQTLNVNLSTNISLQSQELNTHLMKRSSTTPILQSCSSEFNKRRCVNSTSIKTQLTKIHQIHNTSFWENITNSNSKNTQEDQNDTTKLSNNETTNPDCIQNNVSRNPGVKLTVTAEETVSTYFRNQESHSFINGEELAQEKKQTHTTLKEKLTKAKSSVISKVSVQGMDRSITIEEMAKNRELHQVDNSVLSKWLKDHSIPHDPRGRKADLINKVIFHMRNTQVLHQFRM